VAAQVLGTVGTGVQIARADGVIINDANVISQFVGSQTVQSSVALLWPLPPDPSGVQGVFNGLAQATANTRTLEAHALASVGGTLIPAQEFAVANASMNVRFSFSGPVSAVFPVTFFFDLRGGVESRPLPGEEPFTLARGSLNVRADGLLGAAAGSPIGEVFNSTIAISTRPAENSASTRLRVDILAESFRGFTLTMALQALSLFNATADFSHTATLTEIVVPLAYGLQINGVDLQRDGTRYTVIGQASAVPELPVWALLASGLIGLALRRRRPDITVPMLQ